MAVERVWGAFRHTGRFGSITTLDRGNFEAPLLEIAAAREAGGHAAEETQASSFAMFF